MIGDAGGSYLELRRARRDTTCESSIGIGICSDCSEGLGFCSSTQSSPASPLAMRGRWCPNLCPAICPYVDDFLFDIYEERYGAGDITEEEVEGIDVVEELGVCGGVEEDADVKEL